MKWILYLVLLVPSLSEAYVDLSLSYTFSMRKVDGINADGSTDNAGEALTTSKGYSVNWAWYIWKYTAIEMNYGETTERLEDDRQVVDGTLTIKKLDSTVKTKIAGVGIKQSLAPKTAAIIPSIAIGYAKYTTSGSIKYLLNDGANDLTLSSERDEEEFSSSYATASLKFRITKTMGLTFAAKTVMPDFKTEEASKNVTYSAGFSWLF